MCSRSAYARESSSETPTNTEKVRPERVSAFRTARLIHSSWLGVNESPAGTRATHMLAGVVALDTALADRSLLGVGSRSLLGYFETRVHVGLQLR